MTWAPGSNRLLVVERRSKLYTFENSPIVEKADLLLDISQLGNATYGAAFHPEFQKNGYVFVGWNGAGETDKTKKHTKLTRYTMTSNVVRALASAPTARAMTPTSAAG